MQRWRGLLALLSALMLVLAACSGDTATDTTAAPAGDGEEMTTTTAATDGGTTETTAAPDEGEVDLAGTTVTVFGPESSDVEAGAMQDALDVLSERTGIDIQYTGARDAEEQVNAQVAGGNPPDIFVFPQPGKLADFAEQGFLVPLPDDVVGVMNENWDEAFTTLGNVDGTQFGLPNKNDLKSLVWYQPGRFEEAGYEVPETWDDLKALTEQMIADGNTPWCVGVESGPATGWPFTDWVEDLMLRFHGPEVYDQWVAHEIPFNDDRVVQVWNEVLNLWNTPGAVFAAGGSITATPFGDNGAPLVNGECFMHRQASFFASFIPEGTPYVEGEGAVDVFYFPPVDPADQPVLGGGTFVAAFRDAPEVWEVMKYYATPEYAENRQVAQVERAEGTVGETQSGFLSAVNGIDESVYSPLEQSFLDILRNASVVRFDASDLMPAAVGAGTFWTEATSAIAGNITAEEATANIEASWPTE